MQRPQVAVTGVQSLVDNGINELPQSYVRPEQERPSCVDVHSLSDTIPVIDLSRLEGEERAVTLDSIHRACREWGFFQVQRMHAWKICLQLKLFSTIIVASALSANGLASLHLATVEMVTHNHGHHVKLLTHNHVLSCQAVEMFTHNHVMLTKLLMQLLTIIVDQFMPFGRVQVVNHGVPVSLMQRMKEVAENFFALPLEEKQDFKPQPGRHASAGKFGTSFNPNRDAVLDWRDVVRHYFPVGWEEDAAAWPHNPPFYK